MQAISVAVGLVGTLLLILWWRGHRRGDRARCLRVCGLGAALALAHLLVQLAWVKHLGAPPEKGSPEQHALMFRLAFAGIPANLMLVFGLFELSFARRRARRP